MLGSPRVYTGAARAQPADCSTGCWKRIAKLIVTIRASYLTQDFALTKKA